MFLLVVALLGCTEPAPPPRSVPTTPTALVPEVVSAHVAHAGGGHLVDVRAPEVFALGHPAGAVNVPFSDLDAFSPPFTGWSKHDPVWVLSEQNRYASVAAQTLAAAGYRASLVEGGAWAWQEQGLPWEIQAK